MAERRSPEVIDSGSTSATKTSVGMRKRVWRSAAGAALVVGVGLGVGIWFVAHSAANAAAVQAVTSYVLVLVTAAYVALTYALVSGQRRSARNEIEANAIAKLSRLLHDARTFLIPACRRIFPLPGRGELPDVAPLASVDRQLLDLYWALHNLTPDCPADMEASVKEAWGSVWMASSDTVNILWAFRKEGDYAHEEKRDWTWEGAARIYREEHEVGRERDPGFWFEMIRGDRVLAAVEALDALDGQVRASRSRY